MISNVLSPTDPHREVKIDLLLETGGGGSGRHVLDLYRGLRAAGWEAHLLLSSRRMEATFAAEVAALPREHVTFLDLRRSPHLSDVAAIAAIRRYLRRSGGVHLLHAHSTKAGIIGWGLGWGPGSTRRWARGGMQDGTQGGATACRVLTPHAYRGMDITLGAGRAKAIRLAEAVFSRAYDDVIAVSPEEVEYTVALGVASARVHYVPNGVDGQRVGKAAALVRSARLDQGRAVIGFVGRLAYQKNPELFLQTIQLVRARGMCPHVVLVGEGGLKEELVALADRLNLTDCIEWCGNIAAVEELGRMDVLVHTSRYESFPYVLLEAVAASVPVVSVDNAGSRAIFGGTFPEGIMGDGTASALADRVMLLLTDEAVRARHLAAYERIAQEFSLDRMVERTVDIYRAALARSATRTARKT